MNTAIQREKLKAHPEAAQRPMIRWCRRAWLLAPALVLTLLNLPKPLTVDDAAYYYFARHIAQDPLRPYDFQVFWYEGPQPANTVLAPPVLPYWWALGLHIFGERPWLWKLWLFPFSLLFVGGLHAVYRRFARGMETPLVWLTVLSPLFLPSLNLMLDVPALALALTALALFFRACGRRSLGLAAAAGLIAGLAIQTKYTALLVPAVMLLYAVTFRRLRCGLVASGVAGAIFVGWECLVWLQQGQSHFAANLPDYPPELWQEMKLGVTQALLPMLGGVTPAVTLVGLAALGFRRSMIAFTGAALALGYLLIARVDKPVIHLGGTFWLWQPIEQAIFHTCGILFAVTVVMVVWNLWFAREDRPTAPAYYEATTRFLALWLVLEIAGYFTLTPFPAARRVMGLFVISTLLVGRLAARTCLSEERRTTVRAVVMGGAALGLLFYGVDLTDAFAQQRAPQAAAQYIAEHSSDESARPTTWYVGHWGFQFYAERLGMKPVQADYSHLQSGDWLVVPEERWNQQGITIDPQAAREEREIAIQDSLPLRTVQCFYGGFVPLEHHAGPRIRLRIYRITSAWVPTAR